jgi:hypothetical protein
MLMADRAWWRHQSRVYRRGDRDVRLKLLRARGGLAFKASSRIDPDVVCVTASIPRLLQTRARDSHARAAIPASVRIVG